MNPEARIEFARRLQTEGSIRNSEVHFRCKHGTEKVGLGSAELIEIANERCILSVIADITESRQTQERLRESQKRVGGVIDSAMDAIIAIDEEQRIVLFNPAAEKDVWLCCGPCSRYDHRSLHPATLSDRPRRPHTPLRRVRRHRLCCGCTRWLMGRSRQRFPSKPPSLKQIPSAGSCLPSSFAT